MGRTESSATTMLQTVLIAANNSEPNSRNNALLAALIGIETVLPLHRVVQHGFYAVAFGTPSSFGNARWPWSNSRSSGIARFVKGGVVKTFRYTTSLKSDATRFADC